MYATEKNNFIRNIYYDENKHLLLAGCYNGGIQLYDTLGNALWKNAISSQTVKDINVIEKLSGNDYFIETFGKGWYILNLSSKKIIPFSLTDSIKNKINTHAINFINNLQRINDSTVFIATTSNVFECGFKNAQLKSALPLLPLSLTASEQITCFFFAAHKTLWAGTTNGILYKADENKHLQTIHIPENYLIRSLTEDAQHNVWAGTEKGLYVYNMYGAPIKNFTMQSGLLNDCIYALLPVKNKAAVFASSNLGLSYVSLNRGIINYTKESGLQENEFNTGSAIKTRAGKYYFGGVNGITAFYPSALFNIKDTPVLNITHLIISDSSYDFSPKFRRNDSLILDYTQNHLQFDITALGLLNPTEFEYRYRMKGFEENWQKTNQPTGIKYVLQPGEYSLEITCHPVFSSGNNFTRSVYIIVSPPWWQTWWFRCLIVLLCVAIIAFAVLQYSRRKYVQKIRALELRKKIQEERERISRDLHDNLGAYAAAIASNVATIKFSQNGKDENVLQQLKNNSQSIINQLNDTIWALNKEAISLTAVSDRFKVFLQKIQPNYPDINIEIKEEILNDEKLSPTNALHLFRIMQESVNNALKHSNCKNILIELVSHTAWKIIIKDDGKGMPVLNDKMVYGNGLSNIKTRSETAGWNIKWISESLNGTELIISSATIN